MSLKQLIIWVLAQISDVDPSLEYRCFIQVSGFLLFCFFFPSLFSSPPCNRKEREPASQPFVSSDTRRGVTRTGLQQQQDCLVRLRPTSRDHPLAADMGFPGFDRLV